VLHEYKVLAGISVLKNLDPLLTPELLFVLASMGHGDVVGLVDEHFPAESIARSTVHAHAIHLPGISCTAAARAILSVLPLDDTVSEPARRMRVEDKPDDLPDVQREVQAEIDAAEGRSMTMGSLGRWEYYDEARQAYALVWTGDQRLYGCFLFNKGFIRTA
jgi:L-fucose mutarotase